ncbi:hypothetical protein BDL97_13G017800 [Sphagnum fallax]|nr:hypothetical protein BDL97_13G017800 [Sphagnum fallax]
MSFFVLATIVSSSISHGPSQFRTAVMSIMSGLDAEIGAAAASDSRAPEILPETNIGFKLLKKSGWKEGTGLGASEQGRLAPLETHVKQDRRGIGAENKKKKRVIASLKDSQDQHGLSKKQGETKEEKGLSKKARKAHARAQQEQEQAFTRDFFREFWPENV